MQQIHFNTTHGTFTYVLQSITYIMTLDFHGYDKDSDYNTNNVDLRIHDALLVITIVSTTRSKQSTGVSESRIMTRPVHVLRQGSSARGPRHAARPPTFCGPLPPGINDIIYAVSISNYHCYQLLINKYADFAWESNSGVSIYNMLLWKYWEITSGIVFL